MEGAHGVHERAEQRLDKANRSLKTGMDNRGKATVDPGDIDYTDEG